MNYPPIFIVFATTSQLADTISEGLRNIKNQSKNLFQVISPPYKILKPKKKRIL